jgi:hypothetical protein
MPGNLVHFELDGTSARCSDAEGNDFRLFQSGEPVSG